MGHTWKNFLDSLSHIDSCGSISALSSLSRCFSILIFSACSSHTSEPVGMSRSCLWSVFMAFFICLVVAVSRLVSALFTPSTADCISPSCFSYFTSCFRAFSISAGFAAVAFIVSMEARVESIFFRSSSIICFACTPFTLSVTVAVSLIPLILYLVFRQR